MDDLDKCKELASQTIDRLAPELANVAMAIWDNPELGLEEHYAHSILSDKLEEYGFSVQRNYVLPTAFRAEYGQGEINIAFLCEYDALPEIGHACGHNLIAELGLGAALAVKDILETNAQHFKVTVLGTPSEEMHAGKKILLKHGAFDDVTLAMMAHPYPLTTVHLPGVLAINGVRVVFEGEASHAAVCPWQGRNALDAAVAAYNNVSCLRQQMPPTYRVHGVITKGGSRPDIIPEQTEMEYFVRAPTVKELNPLMEKIDKCFQAAGMATSCQVRTEWYGGPLDSILTNQILSKLYRKNAALLGVDFCEDEDKLQEGGASTDMGDVTHKVPGIHPWFYIGTDAPIHTKIFKLATGVDTAQSYVLQQAKALAWTALDVYFDPDLITQIKNEFDKAIL